MERDADLASIAAAIDAQADNTFLLGTEGEFSAVEKRELDRAVLHLERAVEALERTFVRSREGYLEREELAAV